MRLYAGTSKNFIEDTVRNQIAEKLQRTKTRTKKILIKDLVPVSFRPCSRDHLQKVVWLLTKIHER